MFQGMSFHEVVYGFRPPEFVRFSRKLQLPEHFVQTLEDFISMRKNVAEATFHMIHTDHTDFYKRQDLRWYQQMKAGTRLADNIPIGTRVFMDMFPKHKPPKMVPRFNGPFIVPKKLERGAVVILFQDGSETVANLDRRAVVIRFQDGSETVANLDRLQVLKGQPQVEWSEQLILTEKEGQDSPCANLRC
jgi:hypothetical protein